MTKHRVTKLVFFWAAIFLGLACAFADGDASLQLTPVSGSNNSSLPYSKSKVASAFDPGKLFTKNDPMQERAFQNVATQAMPMNPEQIVRLKNMLAETQKAAAATAGAPPKPMLSTQMVSLAPGATPPVIRLEQGFVTSVVFVDSTGTEWPIVSYDVGNPQAFNIQWQDGTNTLMIQAMKMYAYGNLAVKLKGLSTPVMVTLIPGQNEVDYRADLQIEQQGPNSDSSNVATKVPSQASGVLLSILDGVPPKGAQELQVDGGDANAWEVGDKIYLRTGLTLLSPSWLGVMSSPDGTNVYELNKTSTILVSQNGTPIQLKIEGV